jgi:hypothetical protein
MFFTHKMKRLVGWSLDFMPLNVLEQQFSVQAFESRRVIFHKHSCPGIFLEIWFNWSGEGPRHKKSFLVAFMGMQD